MVVATVMQKPATFRIICGADRECFSCEASANVRIKIPLQRNNQVNNEFQSIQVNFISSNSIFTDQVKIQSQSRKQHNGASLLSTRTQVYLA